MWWFFFSSKKRVIKSQACLLKEAKYSRYFFLEYFKPTLEDQSSTQKAAAWYNSYLFATVKIISISGNVNTFRLIRCAKVEMCHLGFFVRFCATLLWVCASLSLFKHFLFLFNYFPRTLGSSSIPTFNSVRDYILTRLSLIIWFQFHSKCGNSPAALVMNMMQVGCIMLCFFLLFFFSFVEFRLMEINKWWKNMTSYLGKVLG